MIVDSLILKRCKKKYKTQQKEKLKFAFNPIQIDCPYNVHELIIEKKGNAINNITRTVKLPDL